MSRHRTMSLFLVTVVALVASAGCTGGTTPPPAPTTTFARPAQSPAQPPAPAAAGRTSLGSSKQAADLAIALFSAPNPPIRGANALEAVVTDAQGQPVTDVQVAFDLDMTNMSHGKNIVVATPQGEGRYAGQVFFMMPGPWRVITFIQRQGQPTLQARFDFQVNLR
jgi:hypothetical protein